jgi:hypothetical protein
MKRRLGSIASLVASLPVLIAAVGFPQSAEANPATGHILISGKAGFSNFPCGLPKPGDPACTATMPPGSDPSAATIEVDLAGRDSSGTPWALHTGVPVTTQFTYIGNLGALPWCTSSFGQGTGSFTAPTGQAFGAYQTGQNIESVVGATGSFQYSYFGSGTAVTVDIKSFSLTVTVLETDGLFHTVNVLNYVPTSDSVNGTGNILPDESTQTQPVLDCLNETQRAGVTATVVWDWVLASPS